MKDITDKHNILNFKKERNKRIHDLHEKNLQEINKAFENAFPLSKNKKINKKNKSKKK